MPGCHLLSAGSFLFLGSKIKMSALYVRASREQQTRTLEEETQPGRRGNCLNMRRGETAKSPAYRSPCHRSCDLSCLLVYFSPDLQAFELLCFPSNEVVFFSFHANINLLVHFEMYVYNLKLTCALVSFAAFLPPQRDSADGDRGGAVRQQQLWVQPHGWGARGAFRDLVVQEVGWCKWRGWILKGT